MGTKLLGVIAGIGTMLCSTPSRLMATPPTHMVVTYSIHDDPQDPESDVVFRITLGLDRFDYNATSIGWEISEAQFETVGGTEMIWTAAYPYVDSLDGLWWTDHADVDNPVLAEFLVPPTLEGTAEAKNSEDPDLDYLFAGNVYTPPAPPGQPPFGSATGSSTFSFLIDGDEEPMEEGEAEPVELSEPA